MDNLISLFLFQAYKDCWEDYKRSLTSASFPHWDYVILTASNEQQAEGFRKQLEIRKKYLPKETKFVVIPDEGGVRVGSGGATLSVIRYLMKECGSLDGLCTLVIHSGGDSKRVPQYSALGKLFSPVPHELPDGRLSTLFDEFMICMSSVPSRIREGMLLLSGDVLLLFNPLQIDYAKDAAAISFKEHVSTGANHGVYLNSNSGNVRKCLQKQSIDTLRAVGAVNEADYVDIDTGAVIFSNEMLTSLYSMIDTEEKYTKYVNDTVRLSLYADFLYPLAEDSTLDDFYKEKPEGEFCPELLEARKIVWELLRPYRMKLLRLAPAKFIHFGTTREIMELMNSGVDSYQELGWKKTVGSSIPKQKAAGYNSVLSSKAEIGKNCYLEVSYVHSKAHVGDNVVLSHIDIHDETVPSNVVLHGLKDRNGRFVCRIFGVQDNPKSNTLFGVSLEEIEKRIQVSLWDDGDPHVLWTARLYEEQDSIQEAVASALRLYHAVCTDKNIDEPLFTKERKSLCSGFNAADPDAIIDWSQRMTDLVRMDEVSKAIRGGIPAHKLEKYPALSKIQEEWMEKHIREADYSRMMRLYYYFGTVLEDDVLVGKCFKTVSDTILKDAMQQLEYNDHAHIVTDKHTVNLPLRVNWGGGWSDTPPYCNECGGTVLNAAILLDGKKPVEVTMERIPEYKIVFESHDMGVHGEFTSIEPLQETGDPYDPFALQKACLLACGIIPKKGHSLEEILKKLGGGFVMQSEVTNVPKGSGLGTSSILSAACVKCVFEFMGIAYSEDDLYSHVLVMEQIMSTGGGWQDQVGGVTLGIKYITSRPGISQKIKVTHIELDEETKQELNERFILIYTGQRRLARNLLRDVIGRYVGNEPDSLYALEEIQKVAALMRFELERGNVDGFARLLDRHWELSKMVDAGSSNTLIDQIFCSVEDLIDGKLVCGAGGGGFLQAVMKRGVKKEQVEARLKQVFMDSLVRVWNCEILW